MKYKIVTNRNASGLTNTVKELIADGWKPKGSHRVVETRRENRFAGAQVHSTIITVEYSQTLIKK